MSYQEWQYQTSLGISATLALGPDRALILANLPDSFMTIIILAGSTNGLTRDLLEELADSFDLSKLTPIVLPGSLYIPSPQFFISEYAGGLLSCAKFRDFRSSP